VRAIAAAGIGLILGIDTAVAGADSFGTAGPLREIGGGSCAAGVMAQMRGQCDPLPVDPNLPSKKRSQAEVDRALKLVALLRMDEAKKSLDAAIVADQRNVAAYKLRARLQIPDALDRAEADVNAGLLLEPSDSDLLATRALLLFDQHHMATLSEQVMDAAVADINAAIAANPANVDALWIRARIFRELGRLDAAEADLTEALTLQPDVMRARILRAQIRMMRAEVGAAVEDASVVLAQNPMDLSARQLRAIARVKLDDLPGASEDFAAILGEPGKPRKLNPSNAMFGEFCLQRAIILAALGRADDAMRDLDTITTIGGPRAILRMQVYLRSHGFPDVPIDGKRSELFDDAIKACFVDKACGRGMTRKS
jgi:tetratricopeptide (TPR) repeat protein